MRLTHAIVALVLSAIARPATAQQTPYPSNFSRALVEQREIGAALSYLESNFTRQVDEWIRIAEMQGKSGHEQERGAYLKRAMEEQGLVVAVDSIGNVVGRRKGTGGGPTIVFAAHLDIVHPLGTNLKVHRDGDTLRAPGIFDNSASVANMLAMIRALNAAKVQTKGDLIFIGTAQEELGLRGMEFWWSKNPKEGDMLVSMDGGLGPIMYGALGIYWTRYYFRGEGSHTNTSTGKPHPARALADAIKGIYEMQPPQGRDGAVFNVGMVKGGEIFNGIPQEVWFSMDLRSVNPILLDALDREIQERVKKAAESNRVQWSMVREQQNRAGGTEAMLKDRRAHPIVQTAIDIHRFLGIDIGAPGSDAVASGSTDGNVGVVRGIPTVAIGRARGGNQHTLSEWSHWPSALPATKMVLLLGMSLAGVGGNAVQN